MVKTKFVLFRSTTGVVNNDAFKIFINGTTYSLSESVKFLGIVFDEGLKFNIHIDQLCKKISKDVYLLYCSKKFMPVWAKRLLYFSYVQSHLMYGLSIWGPLITAVNKDRLLKLQKKAVRAIYNLPYYGTTVFAFKELNVLKFEDLLKLEMYKLSYLFTNDHLPYNMLRLFNANALSHAYNTRHRRNPRIEYHRTSIFHRSFLCLAPSLWQNAPRCIKTAPSVQSLKKQFINIIYK